ncbi:hypothetical protein [Gilvimarinus agarilyticus]|uniref:hypothetical protein n=1 Tax=Gilvimarinus agarilyticus TaxID=679259 RepID=UPI0005A10A68|nr:hypothetical protein [Gilvimarinus agarilyticus]
MIKKLTFVHLTLCALFSISFQVHSKEIKVPTPKGAKSACQNNESYRRALDKSVPGGNLIDCFYDEKTIERDEVNDDSVRYFVYTSKYWEGRDVSPDDARKFILGAKKRAKNTEKYEQLVNGITVKTEGVSAKIYKHSYNMLIYRKIQMVSIDGVPQKENVSISGVVYTQGMVYTLAVNHSVNVNLNSNEIYENAINWISSFVLQNK